MSDYDLRYLAAGLEALEPYLLNPGLYWPPGVEANPGQPPYPSLTPGSLILALRRAETRATSNKAREEYNQIDLRFTSMKTRWRSAWEKKVLRDFHARLGLWRNFLEEFRENPAVNQDRYPYEITRRVQLHLLLDEARDFPAAELQMLSGLDRKLRAIFRQGGFVWEADLVRAFPQEPFWYLYGMMTEE
jgi:hypothetical protein